MMANNARRGTGKGRKGPTTGSGGQRRRGLEGRGPTPKAEDRVHHKAYRGGRDGADGSGGRGSGAGGSGAGRSGAGRSGGGRSARGRSGGDAPEQITGRNSVLEALREGVPATALHVAARIDVDERVREILTLTAQRKLPLLESPRTELDRLTDRAIHQGVVLTVPPYEYAEVDDLLEAAAGAFEPPLLVALDGITDPRNLGAILRSAGAFGAHGVIVPARRAVGMTAGVYKVAAGAATRVPVARVTNLTRTLEELKSKGVFVAGLAAGGDVTSRETALGDAPLVIVVGSEGKGISRLVRETCDQIVSVPIASTTESLNASVAAAIALYEVAGARAVHGIG